MAIRWMRLLGGLLIAFWAAGTAPAVPEGATCGGGLTVEVPAETQWPGNAPEGLPREEPEVLHAMELPVLASDRVGLRLEGVVLGPEGVLLLSDAAAEEFLVYTMDDVGPDGALETGLLPGGKHVTIEVISPSPGGDESLRVADAVYWFRDAGSREAMAAQVEAGYRARRTDPRLDSVVEWDGPDRRVIYGTDSRREIYEVEDPQLRAMAESVALVTTPSVLYEAGEGRWGLDYTPWTQAGGGTLCDDEPFRGQPTPGSGCSSFLVGPDLIVTAGHCISAFTCSSRVFVFGFEMLEGSSEARTVFEPEDVYFCQQVEARQLTDEHDWAVVRLDRPVTGREPLPIRKTGQVPQGTPLAMIGHPSALPMKLAGDAAVQSSTGSELPWFTANLDAYAGNSGSPVINTQSHEVEGILVRGQTDFRVREGDTCRESNVLPHSGGAGGTRLEAVNRTTDFAEAISDEPLPTPTPTPTPTPVPMPRTEIVDTLLGYIPLPPDGHFETGDRNQDGVLDAADVFLPRP